MSREQAMGTYVLLVALCWPEWAAALQGVHKRDWLDDALSHMQLLAMEPTPEPLSVQLACAHVSQAGVLLRPAFRAALAGGALLVHWRRPGYTVVLYCMFYLLVLHCEWLPAGLLLLLLGCMLSGKVNSQLVGSGGTVCSPSRSSRAVPLSWMDVRRPRHSVLVLLQACARHVLESVEGCYSLLEWQDPVASGLFCLLNAVLLLLAVLCSAGTLLSLLGAVLMCWHTQPCVHARRVANGVLRWYMHGRQNHHSMMLMRARSNQAANKVNEASSNT
eukprot:TRINITY_DN13863_c0_g1_i5.p1 TRINITY_DN13863_c0_g1~~TRINITY_DN13863_c0_g1_i5.p1  ORF type:complete len:275 (-),score=91.52 TRINITY_DN13863_c0_g1_i5:140-964(-)